MRVGRAWGMDSFWTTCGVRGKSPRASGNGRARKQENNPSLRPSAAENRTNVFRGDEWHKLERLDVVVALAGGLKEDGTLPMWVQRRMDACNEVAKEKSCKILCTGGGTPHAPPFLGPGGFVVHEGTACAQYLIEKGVSPSVILKEHASYDTIGNGYYVMTCHAIPSSWTDILVVTSEFHMPRTIAIFEWMFGLLQREYNLSFLEVSDDGIDQSLLDARRRKESESLKQLLGTIQRIQTLPDLHTWLHESHRCYSVSRQHEIGYIPPEVKNMLY